MDLAVHLPGQGLVAMTRLLVDTARYTVIRQNDGSIEIAPKDNPKGMRVFHRQAARYEGELIAAYHRNGFVGVDRLCARLLADAGDGARRGGSGRATRHLDGQNDTGRAALDSPGPS